MEEAGKVPITRRRPFKDATEERAAHSAAKKRLKQIEESMYGRRYPEEDKFYESIGMPFPPPRP